MGVFLDKPKVEKETSNGEGNGLRFGLSAMQGWRTKMEDAHSCVLGLPSGLKDWSFFAVYDGHAGAFVSNHCATNLLDVITKHDAFQNYDSDKHDDATIREVIRLGFLELDTLLRQTPTITNGEESSGTTVSSCLLSPTKIFFANCGDSRALICKKGNVAFSTRDHKPHLDDEKNRIEAAGGSVIMMRVNGSLAVSRALGDFEYKDNAQMAPVEQLVSPEPEVTVLERNPDEDEYIVVACDGIWDEMTNEDLCAFVSSRLRITGDLEKICNDVIDTCLHKGSRDNMSIILITFPAAPIVQQEAVAAEQDLDSRLKKRIDELMDQDKITSINEVLEILSTFEGLPPGGGVHSKRNFIWDYMVEKNPALAEQSEDDSSSAAGSHPAASLPIEIISQRYQRFAAAMSGATGAAGVTTVTSGNNPSGVMSNGTLDPSIDPPSEE
ncbi:protein phosphatase 1A-like [Convolutriloba macropyga]|uniref:protein phosphatase 1A-like n=1 Tax=Convolutriloba macropyga TaxID=536237 RepID=UPI003F525487